MKYLTIHNWRKSIVARLTRVVAPGVAHHITQRATAPKYLLGTDAYRTGQGQRE